MKRPQCVYELLGDDSPPPHRDMTAKSSRPDPKHEYSGEPDEE